ncbi:hypothetical protein N7466_006391 [Penicillium verhagenii]|uniref:uncharacterized protein n=1 Tax=Penicillium verhagenii TaxID=1562060 RepID=UPI0025453170|nr:uncharacterized protein N7466_006391 [Penicillium verhagenii]KAJ5930898.1 hypothetical protein N7466_006391 [Penicillium verhagenii]
MQFITVIIATLAAVATATPSPDAFEKRTCVGTVAPLAATDGNVLVLLSGTLAFAFPNTREMKP